MTDRLFIGVLGNRNSGKSSTWNTMFGSTVRTGQNSRTLELYDDECTEVFLINGSPEERNLFIGDMIQEIDCQIILCSIQYTESVRRTLDFVSEEGFDFFVQWLNPGYNDESESYDRLGLMTWLLGHNATVSMRDGQEPAESRTEEIRQFIHGWAKARGLTFACR